MQKLEELEVRAANGESKAQLELATMFAVGEGVEQDFKLAVFWYKKAALDDCPEAYYNLGLMYFLGEGVRKNINRALCFFLKGVEFGSSDACLVIADAYEGGLLGLSVDYSKSVEFYLKAARLGSIKGIRAVGELLASKKISSDELSGIMKNFKL